MSWIAENLGTILMIAGAVLALAAVIVKLTPTPVDDVVVDVLRKLLGLVPVPAAKRVEPLAAPEKADPAPVLGGETQAPKDKGSSTDAKREKLPLR